MGRQVAPGYEHREESEMQFGVLPPVRSGGTADGPWLAAFARLVEGLGFESIVLVEHAVIVSGYQSRYPYSSSGRMPLPDDCAIPDPLDAMAYLAGVTDRITLATGVLVAPNHHPVVLAKRIASVDQFSGGRVRMCLGVGWMDEEVRATGADPRTRGRRTDETIAALRALWTDSGSEGAEYRGDFFSFEHAHSFPKPFRGDVPVHIGGHSEAAAQRAGRLGDGFQPLGIDGTLLGDRMDTVRRTAEQAGRDPDDVELTLSGYLPAVSEEDVEAAERAGAVRLVVSTSISTDLAALEDELSGFAERFGVVASPPPLLSPPSTLSQPPPSPPTPPSPPSGDAAIG
jgi:probable F420-dependent oxidoreductase